MIYLSNHPNISGHQKISCLIWSVCVCVCVYVHVCMHMQCSKEGLCEELCGLLTDVCLGLGVWQHIQKYVRFCFLFFMMIFNFFGRSSLRMCKTSALEREGKEIQRERERSFFLQISNRFSSNFRFLSDEGMLHCKSNLQIFFPVVYCTHADLLTLISLSLSFLHAQTHIQTQ